MVGQSADKNSNDELILFIEVHMCHVKTLLTFVCFLAQICAYAICPDVAPDFNLQCSGTFKAKNLNDLSAYLQSYKTNNGKPKHLQIDFNLTGADVAIASPCYVTFNKQKTTELSGNLCVHARAIRGNASNF